MVRLLHTGLQDSDVIQKLQGQLDQALRMIVQLQKGNQQNGVSPAGGAKRGPPSSAVASLTSTPSTNQSGSAAKPTPKGSSPAQAGIASKVN